MTNDAAIVIPGNVSDAELDRISRAVGDARIVLDYSEPLDELAEQGIGYGPVPDVFTLDFELPDYDLARDLARGK